MREILFQYQQVAPTTWIYLSSLLLIALFFKFNRVWSVRNLDLILLILLAPGLLFVIVGRNEQQQASAVQREIAAASQPDTVEQLNKLFARQLREQQRREGNDDASADASAGQPDEPLEPAGDSPEQAVRQTRLAEAAALHDHGVRIERIGFFWLLGTASIVLIRLLADPTMVRRPQLDPNLTVGGMLFMLCCFYLFLMANVIISRPTSDDLGGPVTAARWLAGEREGRSGLDRNGPGYAALFMLPTLPTAPVAAHREPQERETADELELDWQVATQWMRERLADRSTNDALPAPDTSRLPPFQTVRARYGGFTREGQVVLLLSSSGELDVPLDQLDASSQRMVAFLHRCTITAKTIAVLSHLAVLIGMVVIGGRHFRNATTGVAVALIYLILPYTAHMTGRVDHVLPAAILLWALAAYRRPVWAGALLGLATGVIYYPIFLLPLWASFYWHRGLGRFTAGFLAVIGLMLAILFAVSHDLTDFWHNTQNMLGLMPPQTEGLRGIWGLGLPPVYRLTALAAFVALCGSLALWPAQKNFGTLLSCTAAVMVATQFWHGYGGGLYMAWYLPPMLLTFFRPNLEDRVALVVLQEGWRPKRHARSPLAPVA